MAIVQNPITGRTKKKFGTAVFSKQFGKNTMRTKPMEVKNPRTPDQVNQRSKFAIMVAESRKVLGMVKVSYQNKALTMSAFNAFIKENIKTAIVGIPGSYAIDYSLLVVSRGPLYAAPSILAGNDLASKVKRTWAPPIDPLDPINNDQMYAASYNEDKNEWLFGKTITTREMGTDQQTVPAAWTGDTVHVYTFFVSPDGAKCCDSVYSGTVVVI
jgi:hypothetical protein